MKQQGFWVVFCVEDWRRERVTRKETEGKSKIHQKKEPTRTVSLFGKEDCWNIQQFYIIDLTALLKKKLFQRIPSLFPSILFFIFLGSQTD